MYMKRCPLAPTIRQKLNRIKDHSVSLTDWQKSGSLLVRLQESENYDVIECYLAVSIKIVSVNT